MNVLPWPAMLLTVAFSWRLTAAASWLLTLAGSRLVGSSSERRLRMGFRTFLLSNVLWVAGG